MEWVGGTGNGFSVRLGRLTCAFVHVRKRAKVKGDLSAGPPGQPVSLCSCFWLWPCPTRAGWRLPRSTCLPSSSEYPTCSRGLPVPWGEDCSADPWLTFVLLTKPEESTAAGSR